MSTNSRGGQGHRRPWADGSELGQLVSRVVSALNAQEIPTAGSVIAAYNRDIQLKAVAELRTALAAIELPLSVEQQAVLMNPGFPHQMRK